MFLEATKEFPENLHRICHYPTRRIILTKSQRIICRKLITKLQMLMSQSSSSKVKRKMIDLKTQENYIELGQRVFSSGPLKSLRRLTETLCSKINRRRKKELIEKADYNFNNFLIYNGWIFEQTDKLLLRKIHIQF